MPSRAGAGAPLAGLMLEKLEETNGNGYGEAGPRVAGAAYACCAYKGLGLWATFQESPSHPSTRPRGPCMRNGLASPGCGRNGQEQVGACI